MDFNDGLTNVRPPMTSTHRNTATNRESRKSTTTPMNNAMTFNFADYDEDDEVPQDPIPD